MINQSPTNLISKEVIVTAMLLKEVGRVMMMMMMMIFIASGGKYIAGYEFHGEAKRCTSSSTCTKSIIITDNNIGICKNTIKRSHSKRYKLPSLY